MGMFDMSDSQVEEWRQKCLALVDGHTGGEELVSDRIRRGEADGQEEGTRPARQGDARGDSGEARDYRLGDEVAAWDRAGLRVSTGNSGGMTALTIESPAEGEKGLMAVLQGAAPPTAGA